MRFWVVLFLLGIGGTLAVAWGSFPLGIPGEWTWERFASPLTLASLVPLMLGAGVHLGVAWGGGRRIEQATTRERLAWLAALAVSTFAWLWIVQEEVPSPLHQLSKSGWVLYYPGPSGYFTDARRSDGHRLRLLAEYERLVGQGDVLHFGTHPPGLIAGYWALMDACRIPWIGRALETTQPASVRGAFDEIERLSARSPARLTRDDRNVLWLAMLLVQTAASLTVWPLYCLVRCDRSPRASWWAACLWAGVPALAIFLPKSDVLIAFLGALALALWLTGLRSTSRRARLILAAATGLTFWVGLGISLALLPVGLVAVLLTVWEVLLAEDRRAKLGDAGEAILVAAAVFLAAIAGVWIVTGLNLPAVWRQNLVNHAGFYHRYPRTWGAWLLVNPLELALAAGLPLTAAAIGACRDLRHRVADRSSGPVLACLVTWGLLWLSGKNSGEAARLWIFLMPWLCWIAGSTIDRWLEKPHGSRLAIAALAAQLCCSAILATHVGGFFGGK